MTPEAIELHKTSKQLELVYTKNECYLLAAEYLRVYSPSAEVRGHHPDQAVLQVGKKNISIISIAAVGNYALQISFDDGHNSGIYSWDYLRELCDKQDMYWQAYLKQLIKNNQHRDPDIEVINLYDPS